MKKENNITKFPKGFFTKIRPEAKDVIDDEIPVVWVRKKAKNNFKKTKSSTN